MERSAETLISRERWGEQLVTLQGRQMPLWYLVQTITDGTGLSVMLGDEIAEEAVTLTVTDAPIRQVLTELANQVDREVQHDHGVISFVGQDKGIGETIVVDAGWQDPDEAMQAITGVVQNATIKRVGSKLIANGTEVETDTIKQVARELRTGRDGWRVELVLVNIDAAWSRRLGVDLAIGGGVAIAAKLGTNISGNIPALGGTQAGVLVEAVFEAAEEGRYAKIERTAILHCLEGGQASFSDGETVPIPQRTVSPQGTVTTNGYTYINTGIDFSVAARRVPHGVMLKLEPRVSSIVGFVEDAPIVNETRSEVEVVVADGEWLVITGLRESTKGVGRRGIPRTINKKWAHIAETEDAEDLVAMVRAVRVFAGKNTEAEKEG